MRSIGDEPQYPPTIEPDGARLRPLRTADADGLYRVFAIAENPPIQAANVFPREQTVLKKVWRVNETPVDTFLEHRPYATLVCRTGLGQVRQAIPSGKAGMAVDDGLATETDIEMVKLPETRGFRNRWIVQRDNTA